MFGMICFAVDSQTHTLVSLPTKEQEDEPEASAIFYSIST
jgi:hypothetical protein